jgi:hypothetical protein
LYLFHCHSALSLAEFSIDCTTEKAILGKHMNFAHIGWVISNQNLFLDKRSEEEASARPILRPG